MNRISSIIKGTGASLFVLCKIMDCVINKEQTFTTYQIYQHLKLELQSLHECDEYVSIVYRYSPPSKVLCYSGVAGTKQE